MNERERAKLRDQVARQRVANDNRGQVRASNAYYDRLYARIEAQRSRLSPKQLEAAALWGDGYTLREIGDLLGITENAAAHRVTLARHKLGVEGASPSESKREMRAKLQELEEAA
jgi:DNA-binding CsgD family transcriptional regulator